MDGSNTPAEIKNPGVLPLELAGLVEFSKGKTKTVGRTSFHRHAGDTLTVVIIRKQMDQMEIFAE